MKLWARIENGAVAEVARKNWLAAEGWLPVTDERPSSNPLTETVELKAHADWTVEADRVVIAYDVTAKSPEAIERAYGRAIDAHLDTVARQRQYTSMQTAVTYRDDPNPQFAAEGVALFEWRSSVWTYATAELQKVKDGIREMPTVEAMIAELPTFTWPDSTGQGA